MFDAAHHSPDSARILMDAIDARSAPAGSCRDQLLEPVLAATLPELPLMVHGHSKCVRLRGTAPSWTC